MKVPHYFRILCILKQKPVGKRIYYFIFFYDLLTPYRKLFKIYFLDLNSISRKLIKLKCFFLFQLPISQRREYAVSSPINFTKIHIVGVIAYVLSERLTNLCRTNNV